MNARLTLSSSFSVAFGLILLYKSMQKLAAADNRYESPVVMVNAAAAEKYDAAHNRRKKCCRTDQCLSCCNTGSKILTWNECIACNNRHNNKASKHSTHQTNTSCFYILRCNNSLIIVLIGTSQKNQRKISANPFKKRLTAEERKAFRIVGLCRRNNPIPATYCTNQNR